MRRLTRTITALTCAGAFAFTLAACEDDSSQAKESQAKQAGYDKLVKRQPANTMGYSPTRETINAWMKTWGKPGKLAYVYIQNARGEYGYYVTKGLPVSYCAMLTPSYEIKTRHQSPVVVPAPGMDGAYYSGGQCNAYYAFDATTGAYLEFTIGANQNFFLYDEPMELPEYKAAKPLGPSSIDDIKN